MTTAISSQSASIGFAIPIDQVMAVLPQLEAHGRVVRGFIGVSLTDATPDLHRALQLGPSRGAIVEDVSPNTPADHAGLRPYDLVTAIDGVPVNSDEDLARQIAARAPGSVSRLEVWREGSARTIPVRLTDRPLPPASRPNGRLAAGTRRPAGFPDQGPLGLTVKDLDGPTVRRLALPEAILGVLVTDVDAAGPARLARIRPGQVLLEINRQQVTSLADYRARVAALRPGDAVALLVYDQVSGERGIYTLVLDPRPAP
jgi:serine protease Do